jgi:hypothetical protein
MTALPGCDFADFDARDVLMIVAAAMQMSRSVIMPSTLAPYQQWEGPAVAIPHLHGGG